MKIPLHFYLSVLKEVKPENTQVQNLEQVRELIDRVDAQIMQLLANRLDLVKKAAHFKNVEKGVADMDREAEIKEKAVKLAEQLGLDSGFVQEYFNMLLNFFRAEATIEFNKIKA